MHGHAAGGWRYLPEIRKPRAGMSLRTLLVVCVLGALAWAGIGWMAVNAPRALFISAIIVAGILAWNEAKEEQE